MLKFSRGSKMYNAKYDQQVGTKWKGGVSHATVSIPTYCGTAVTHFLMDTDIIE